MSPKYEPASEPLHISHRGGVVERVEREGRVRCDLDRVPREPARVVRWLRERYRQVRPCSVWVG